MSLDDLPGDVRRAAETVVTGEGGWISSANGIAVVARAIMAERERCARLAEIYPVQGKTADECENAAKEAHFIAAAIRKGEA